MSFKIELDTQDREELRVAAVEICEQLGGIGLYGQFDFLEEESYIRPIDSQPPHHWEHATEWLVELAKATNPDAHKDHLLRYKALVMADVMSEYFKDNGQVGDD